MERLQPLYPEEYQLNPSLPARVQDAWKSVEEVRLPARNAHIEKALEDIDADNGPLIYYPGSHKLHEYSMDDFKLEPGYHNYHKYEECIQAVVEREEL